MEIYELCKENREKLDLTIEEFSKSIGIDYVCYREFEKGNYLFSKEEMKLILTSLYISKGDLVNEFDEDYITNISLKVIDECEKGE